MSRSRNEYEAQLHGRVTEKGIWGATGEADLNDLNNLPPIFKVSLQDFNNASANGISLNKFNLHFYSMKTIACDSYTAEKGLQALLDGTEDESKGGGWVYMYTYLPELVCGLTVTKLGEEEIASILARFKVGVTTVDPFDRVEAQVTTGVPHTAILLGLFWTPSIKRADKVLKSLLDGYRPIECGGEEWYLARPEELLVEILKALEPSRKERKIIPSVKTAIA